MPHGNSTVHSQADYVRTSEKVMHAIQTNLHLPPKVVYNKLVSEGGNTLRDVPRNVQQVKKKQRLEKQKEDGGYKRTNNLADQVLELSGMAETHGDFLRNIHFQVIGKALSPSIVLFTDEQISYIRAFCLEGKSILGFDKTYNLGDLYVTASNFKFSSLHKKNSGEPPVFVGPLFLHSSSTFETFFYFLSVLRSKLFDDATPTCLVFGSDDEKALTRAIRAAFPNSRQALCTLHLKKKRNPSSP